MHKIYENGSKNVKVTYAFHLWNKHVKQIQKGNTAAHQHLQKRINFHASMNIQTAPLTFIVQHSIELTKFIVAMYS